MFNIDILFYKIILCYSNNTSRERLSNCVIILCPAMEMLEIVIMLLSAGLAGTFGYFTGLHRAPKSRVHTEIRKDLEETIDGLRKEKRRWQATANFYKQGAVNSSDIDKSDAGAIIEGVLNSLPPNYRGFLAPFKDKAIQWARENPDDVEKMKEVILAKLSKGGKAGNENGDSQQSTEVL